MKPLVAGTSVHRTKPNWLWRGRLMFGALALLEGDPDKGKSTIMCDLAARVTTGRPMPGEEQGREPAAVVFLSSEDDAGMTLMPRCFEAGADISKVYFLDPTDKEQLLLTDDGHWLEEECARVGAKLVVLDPIVAFLGSKDPGKHAVDTNNDMLVRQALQPLNSIAHRLKASVVGIRHLNKGGGSNAIYRGGGSIAFTAAARSVLTAVKGKDDQHPKVAIAKSNLARQEDRKAIGYRIYSSLNDVDVPVIEWLGSTNETASDLLGGDDMDTAIRSALKAGPKTAGEMDKLRQSLEVPGSTFRRHAKKLGVEMTRGGRPENRTWSLEEGADEKD